MIIQVNQHREVEGENNVKDPSEIHTFGFTRFSGKKRSIEGLRWSSPKATSIDDIRLEGKVICKRHQKLRGMIKVS